MKKNDIVLISLPKLDYSTPLVSLAMLKTKLEENNFTCKHIDFNRDLYNRLNKKDDLFVLKDNTFYDKKMFEKIWNEYLKDICSEWVNELKQYEPKWIGVSLLSNRNRLISIEFFKMIRAMMPSTKIVVGGSYLIEPVEFDKLLIERNLVDHCILYDGENTIVELLKDNIDNEIIDGSEYLIKNLDDLPLPNYDDLDISHYYALSIMTERGCLNHCKFCNARDVQKYFRFKSGKHIAYEMEIMYNKYHHRRFTFADNLLNPNIKEFRILCREIIKKKRKGLLHDIEWGGQMALNDDMIEEDFKLASLAGLNKVSLGIESGSERARKTMRKNFSDKTLYSHLDYFNKYKIKVVIMMMVGWVEETEEDFQLSLEFINKVVKRCNNIIQINVGSPCQLNKFSSAWKEYGLQRDENGHWYYKNNTMKVRLDRWQRLKDLCVSFDGKFRVDLKNEETSVVKVKKEIK